MLGITWLENANLASDEGFGVVGVGPDGEMDFEDANAFIDALNAARYKGFNDWRLPKVLPQDGVEYDNEITVDGTTDYGYNIGPFLNMDVEDDEAFGYWSQNSALGQGDDIWGFSFGCGAQCHEEPQDTELLVWPVRDGGSASKSIPTVSLWAILLLAGMLILTAAVLLRRTPEV